MSTNVNGDTTDPLIGQTVANGKYVIVKLLGEGGMGKVYQGEQKLGDLKRPVAIKTLQPDLAQDPQIATRFLREAGTVGLLEHPNTIKFFESGQLDDGKLFVAMEFIQGESLAHVIARGALAPQKVEHILSQVCGSLGEAHEHGIIHRDIKPENIILTQKGSRGDFVKVLDFGIAKRDEGAEDAAHAKLTRQGMVLGTPPYMSPEQFTGQPLKPMSDIYSLAIVAYEMLTGSLPFQASTPWEWATKHLTTPPMPFETHIGGANIPPRQKAAVLRALSKRAEERPQTMQQFLQEFTGNAGVGNDWSQSTNSAPNAFGSMQGAAGGMYTPAPIPHVATPQPGQMTAPAGSGGMPATMAVNYPQPTPQPFQATSNPGGFVQNNTGPGFAPVNQPPSNPGFNPMQPQQQPYGGYASAQGYAQPPQPQQSGGAGKFIAIGIGVLLLGGIIAGVAVSANSGGNNNNGNNNNGSNTTAQVNTPNNQAGNTVVPPINNGMQPVNNGMQPVNNGMQPIPGNGGMQPIPPNNGMQPIPPNNGMQPIPPTQPTQPTQPQVVRPSVPSVCRGGASRIDELILSGRCPAAQAAYRAMRAAGCAPRGADQSFGSACPRP
ncbi:MAG: protein kinase [Polyangiales bacterium]